jgi:integrase
VPASQELIAQYAAYLARQIGASSVRQYLNIIRLLHLEAGLPNPMQDNWYIKSTLTGIDRLIGKPAKRRTPVHPSLLLSIWQRLDMQVLVDSMFWAAALLMFHGLLRKSNLFPETAKQWDNRKQFVRADFVCKSDGSIVANVKYSKTNQFHKRPFDLKLLQFHHVLSPTMAIHHAFRQCPLPSDAPAFVMSVKGTPMTGKVFNDKFKKMVASTGLDSSTFSSHSFRRGGACWALQCGVPGEIVQQLGDWKSDCYKRYLDELPQQVHDYYHHLFIKHLPPCV